MKKIIAFVISICVVATTLVFPTIAYSADTESGILGLLSELGIMSGDPDGNMRLDDYVSRAEFVKVAVAASQYKNSVATNLAISPFPDVTYRHWAAPYVRVGVTGGIVTGYPDGTFKPDDTVLYEEAITIMLKVLGYENSDFGAAWPAGQVGLADNLDMTDGVNSRSGEMINRRQVSRLVYNTLKTKPKNQASELISVFDSQIREDVTVIAGSGEDSSIASDEIFTTGGTYKIGGSFDRSVIGMKGDAVINENNRMLAFIPDRTATEAEEYVVYSVLDNKVMAYKNGSIRQIDIGDDTAAYKGKSQTTFGMLKSQLELGDRIRVSTTSGGDVDYVTYGKGNIKGPVTSIGGSYKTSWNLPSDVKYTRNGVTVSEDAIENYDVVYYLPDLSTILAYDNKVTGIYENAAPSRDVPTSVTISGKVYEIEGSAAFNKLYSGGSFEFGDTVTLLLGRSNKVADVISPSAGVNGIVGYLTATGTKEYTIGDLSTYKNYYITIVQPDGNSYEYITDIDYKESVNSVVELSFTNGYARLKRTGSPNVSGTVNWSNKKIGTHKLASNVEIIDIGIRDLNYASAYAKIFPQRIDGVTLDTDDIIYVEKNASGEIVSMILNDVTGDCYSYGIVTRVQEREYVITVNEITGEKYIGYRAEYDFIADGNKYTTSKIFSISAGEAVRISGSIANPDILSPILSASGNVSSISADKLVAGDETHKISDKVAVYKKTSASTAEYSTMTLSDLIADKDKYRISAYYDKSSANGGRVRVIVAVEK